MRIRTLCADVWNNAVAVAVLGAGRPEASTIGVHQVPFDTFPALLLRLSRGIVALSAYVAVWLARTGSRANCLTNILGIFVKP